MLDEVVDDEEQPPRTRWRMRRRHPPPARVKKGGSPCTPYSLEMVLVWRISSPSWRLPRERKICDNGWSRVSPQYIKLKMQSQPWDPTPFNPRDFDHLLNLSTDSYLSPQVLVAWLEP
jgi:hypothetical protein